MAKTPKNDPKLTVPKSPSVTPSPVVEVPTTLRIPTQHIYNLIPSPHDERDFLYKPPFKLFPATLPPTVDLRPLCSPIVDQGQLGSCTANALASGVREFLCNREKQDNPRFSRLYLYYHERSMEGTTGEDSGAFIKDGCDVLLNAGICKESTWPYNVDQFKNDPPLLADTEASTYKIHTYTKVMGVQQMKQCLADGDIMASGMAVFSQMESKEATATGIVRVPTLGEQSLGGHAVCCVGYVDTPRGPDYWAGGGYFLMRNSWGSTWGQSGYFKIAYDYVNRNFLYESWKVD